MFEYVLVLLVDLENVLCTDIPISIIYRSLPPISIIYRSLPPISIIYRSLPTYLYYLPISIIHLSLLSTYLYYLPISIIYLYLFSTYLYYLPISTYQSKTTLSVFIQPIYPPISTYLSISIQPISTALNLLKAQNYSFERNFKSYSFSSKMFLLSSFILSVYFSSCFYVIFCLHKSLCTISVFTTTGFLF